MRAFEGQIGVNLGRGAPGCVSGGGETASGCRVGMDRRMGMRVGCCAARAGRGRVEREGDRCWVIVAIGMVGSGMDCPPESV